MWLGDEASMNIFSHEPGLAQIELGARTQKGAHKTSSAFSDVERSKA